MARDKRMLDLFGFAGFIIGITAFLGIFHWIYIPWAGLILLGVGAMLNSSDKY